MRVKGNKFKGLVVFISLALLACNASQHIGDRNLSNVQEGKKGVVVNSEKEPEAYVFQEVHEGIKNYLLSQGDVLEVIYHATAEKEVDDYKLKVDDKIEVEIAYHPDMNRVHVIRPDGRITLPIKGEMVAVGKTPSEVSKEIAKLYSDIFKNPMVTVRVQEYASKVWELRTALQTTERGQAKKITVAPDGYVYLPYVGGVKAAGRSVEELRNEINDTYKSKFGSITVSILLDEVKGNKIFVFGEVNKPGIYTISYPVTLLQALAMAGGARRTGDETQVRILFWDEKLQPHIKVVNVKAIMNKGDLKDEMVIAKNSVIYVPKTTVAKIGEFIEDYIKNIFMFNGVSLGFSYELKGSGGN